MFALTSPLLTRISLPQTSLNAFLMTRFTLIQILWAAGLLTFKFDLSWLLLLTGVILLELARFLKGVDCKITKDLTGKVAIVTGGNSGIGLETALGLAALGCEVVIAARDVKKSNAAVQMIRKKAKNQKVYQIPLDLTSKKAVDQFVEQFKQNHNQVNFLVNNAGIMSFPRRETTIEGFELHLGTNLLGHFYLTCQLWELLKGVKDLRIINLSSQSHDRMIKRTGLNLDDLNLEKGYKTFGAYGGSKLGIVMFTQEIAERLSKVNPTARCVCLNPGFVHTDISRSVAKTRSLLGYTIKPTMYFFARTPRQGAQTSLHCALQDSHKLQNGEYYYNCAVYPKNPMTKDQSAQKRLWRAAEEMLNVKFEVR